MKSYVMEDGRWHHKFSQSWIKTTDICLERARMEHAKTMPNIESDAACIGTAMHLGVETCIASEGLPLHQVIEIAQDEFSRLMRLDGTNGDPEARHAEGVFKWIKYDEAKARHLINLFTGYWYDEVWISLHIDGARTEWDFKVPVVDDAERLIELTGTADYVRGAHIMDWKTSGGGPYKAWEHQRWNIQATAYTYALHQWVDARPTFELVVMHAKGVQRLPIQRGPEHWAWLQTKVTDLAHLIECEVPTWIKSDNHALCSEKWCPAWLTCKGATGITF